jgi:hypothetical protein
MICECVQDTLMHLRTKPLYSGQGQSDTAIVGSLETLELKFIDPRTSTSS